MALSIKKKGFSALLMVFAISLAMGMVWTPDTFGGDEELVSFQGNSYILNIYLDENAYAKAVQYKNAIGLTLPIARTAVIMLDDRVVRTGAGTLLGEDMAAKLFLVALDLSTYPPTFPLVLVRTFISNQDLANYLVMQALRPIDWSTSEIAIAHKEKRDESGCKVESKIEVLDTDGTIEFKTKFVTPEPVLAFETPSSSPLIFGYDSSRSFEVSFYRTVYSFQPPPADVFIDINLDPSSPEGAIFNGQNNIVRFRFVRTVTFIDEIIP